MRDLRLTFLIVLMMLLTVGTLGAVDYTIENILDLWNVRNDLGGNYTVTAASGLNLEATNPETIVAWAASTYNEGEIIEYTDGYAYYSNNGSNDNEPTGDTDTNWTQMWECDKGWQPIGTATLPFHGNFDGGGKIISNLYINRGADASANNTFPLNGEDSVGLFGYVTDGDTADSGNNLTDIYIKNVALTNVSIQGKRGTGALIGKILIPKKKGKLVITENCSATGTVSGFGATGGLVGANNSNEKQAVPIIRYCYANVTVSSTHSSNQALNSGDNNNPYNIKYGGLVGCNENGVTQDSYALGNVSGGDRVGGLAGCSIGGAIFRSYATGSVTQNIGSSSWEGGYGPITGRTEGRLPPGLGGTNAAGSVEDCYYLSSATLTGTTNVNAFGTAQTSAQLKTATPYTNWSSSVWTFSEDESAYPILTGSPASMFHFQSNKNGSFSTASNWNTSSSISGPFNTASVLKPDYTNSLSINIRSADTITLATSKNAFISTTTVNGKLIVASGAVLNIENEAGDDLVVNGELEVSNTLNVGQSATIVSNTGSTITFKGNSSISATTVNGSLVVEDGVTLSVVNNPGDEVTDGFGEIDDLIINGNLEVTGALDIEEITKVIGNTNSTITFNGSEAQTVNLGLTSVYNLTINNSAGVTLPSTMIIYGTLSVLSDNYTIPSTVEVDGLNSPIIKHLSWTATDYNVKNYATTTTLETSLFPEFINRSWTITGNINDADIANRKKVITFYWTSAEDNNYDWVNTSSVPVLFDGGTKLSTATSSNLTTDNRTATFEYNFPQNVKASRGQLTIGLDDSQTLPVELSTFGAFNYQGNSVMIQWITQSESNLDGYRIYRNNENTLNSAEMLDTFINGTNTSQPQAYSFIDKTLSGNGIYYYWIQMLDYDGSNSFYGPAIVEYADDFDHSVDIPLVTGLISIYPNPFNPTTTISYSLEFNSPVEVNIYNIKGQLVKSFDLGMQAQGFHKVVWNGESDSGNSLPSGIYFSKMKTQNKVDIKKIMLLK